MVTCSADESILVWRLERPLPGCRLERPSLLRRLATGTRAGCFTAMALAGGLLLGIGIGAVAVACAMKHRLKAALPGSTTRGNKVAQLQLSDDPAHLDDPSHLPLAPADNA